MGFGGVMPQFDQATIEKMAQQSQPDIQQAASQAPQQLAQALQSGQAPQPDPSQQPQQPQGPQNGQQGGQQQDPIASLLQSEFSRYQQASAPPASGGPVRRLLQNFLGSMSHGLVAPTQSPEYERQRALGNIATLTQAQSMQQMRDADVSMKQQMLQKLQEQQTPMSIAQATQFGHPNWAGMTMQEALGLAAKVLPAEIAAGPTVNTPQALQDKFGLPATTSLKTANTAQGLANKDFPQHQLQPGEAEQLGFPAGTTQIPEALWATAARLQMAKAGKTTDTVEYKDDGKGNIVALPKRTVSSPNVPGGGTPTASPRAGGGASGPRVVLPGGGKLPPMAVGTDSSGQQVAGTQDELRAAGVQNYTPLGAAESAKVNTARQLTSPGGLFDLANKDLAAFKPGELEALAPRWNEFLAGKVGAADPRYVRLRTHVNGLLSTALMQAHVGARGGGNMMEHFEDIANAGKMSRETLQTALDAEHEYVNDKAMRPKIPNSSSSPAGGFAAWKAKQQ